MSKTSSSQRKNPKGGKKVNGGKNGKKEGLSGSSFFTWFMVIALLGVWTSVAVVWFDLVDYEEVLAKAQDFRYNLSEALQGKLGIYDTDGDGDFDVDDAKILLGLKERSVVVPPAEDSKDDRPATQDTTEPVSDDDLDKDLEEIVLESLHDADDDLDKDLEEIVRDSHNEYDDDLDNDLKDIVEDSYTEAVNDLGKAFEEMVQDSPQETADDLDKDLKDIVEESYPEADDDLDKDLEEIVLESLHAEGDVSETLEEDVSETFEEAEQFAEDLEPEDGEQAEDEEPEAEKEVEAVEIANVEAVLAEEQQDEPEVQEDEQAETTYEEPETEEAVDNTFLKEPKVETETESNDQELNEDVKAEPEIEEIYKDEPSAIEEPEEQSEPEVTEEAEPEEEREEQVAVDDNQVTEPEPETLQKKETPSESQATEELRMVGTIVDEDVTFEQEEEEEEEHHTEEEPQDTEYLEVEEALNPDENEELEPEILEAPAVNENEEQEEKEEEVVNVTEEQIEEETPAVNDQEDSSDHPVEGHLDEADKEILQVLEEKIETDLQTEEITQDDKAEESISVSEEQQNRPADESVGASEQNTNQPAAKIKKPKLFNKLDKTIKTELDAAEKLLKKGKVDEALRAFESLVNKYPQSPKARYGKAQSEDNLAEKMRSNDILLKAINTYGEVAELPNVPAELIKLTLKRRADRQQFLGRIRGCVVTLHKLVQLFPDDVPFRNDLGVGYLLLGDNNNAKAVFAQVLAMAPSDGFAKVHYGFILKSENNIAESIPYLKEGLESGEPGTDDGRFYFHLGDALQRMGSQEAYTWYEVGHKKGHFASVWQRSLYNVNGLKAQPWWTARETGFTDLVRTLEANWKVVRDEGLAVMDEVKGLFVPEDENLREKGDWSQYTLWQQGRKNEKSCAAAPKTCALLERFPESTGCRRGQIKYSVMHPGTHVWPHTGPTNCRLRMHLGLVIPKEGCRIRCANDTRFESFRTFFNYYSLNQIDCVKDIVLSEVLKDFVSLVIYHSKGVGQNTTDLIPPHSMRKRIAAPYPSCP
ncbi:hypothetical protein XELAEV_18032055mg [Xenopus laevis]|uniref:Aspartyl/asparaginyl beta-hydroxylase n=1 Tax=Xenopus laevis TaxID=8355 RepID=A0A974CP90_XENLA|nr:hypothetical protein XELAEV_18032055mg [Xenopus laevis]